MTAKKIKPILGSACGNGPLCLWEAGGKQKKREQKNYGTLMADWG